MKIALHIERLVLDGLPLNPAEGARLGRAMEHELARLLGRDGLATHMAAGGAVAKLTAPQMRLAPGQPADGLGRQIARAVHSRLENAG